MPKKKPLQGKPEVHQELDGFEMDINEFGEITTNTDIDKLNNFLNKNVEDKKFRGLDNIPYAKGGEDEEDTTEEKDDLNEIADEFEEFRQFNDKDFKDEFDFDEKDETEGYFNEGKHEYEQFEEEDDDAGKDDEEDDFDDDELLDEYADEYGEEDSYNFDDGDFDDKY